MSKDVATVWWIEADTGELRSKTMGAWALPAGSTFANEVEVRYARNPIEMIVILQNRAGNDWERAEVERLRVLSSEIKRQRAEMNKRDTP